MDSSVMIRIKKMIKDFLEGKTDPLSFSIDLPDFLFDNYEEMMLENQQATRILNENLPDICEEYERGEEPTKFMKKVEMEYKSAFPND